MLFVLQKSVNDISWSPDIATLFASVSDRAIEIWDLKINTYVIYEEFFCDFLLRSYEYSLLFYYLLPLFLVATVCQQQKMKYSLLVFIEIIISFSGLILLFLSYQCRISNCQPFPSH